MSARMSIQPALVEPPPRPAVSLRGHADALVPMARRSGIEAVARAYDAGLSVPAVRS
jgi:hypothetical protein